jgi:hypothetical protein
MQAELSGIVHEIVESFLCDAPFHDVPQKLENKEKQEQELADYFATHPSMYGKLYPTPYQNHKWLADYYHRAANGALQKAGQHQKAAESLSSTSH